RPHRDLPSFPTRRSSDLRLGGYSAFRLPEINRLTTQPGTSNSRSYSSALPAVRLRFPTRLFCQGRPLRSRERKLRGLDSAGGAADRKSTRLNSSHVEISY